MEERRVEPSGFREFVRDLPSLVAVQRELGLPVTFPADQLPGGRTPTGCDLERRESVVALLEALGVEII